MQLEGRELGNTSKIKSNLGIDLVTIVARRCYVVAMFDRMCRIALNVGTLLSQPTCQRPIHNPDAHYMLLIALASKNAQEEKMKLPIS